LNRATGKTSRRANTTKAMSAITVPAGHQDRRWCAASSRLRCRLAPTPQKGTASRPCSIAHAIGPPEQTFRAFEQIFGANQQVPQVEATKNRRTRPWDRPRKLDV
jgi:hypothetical protein